MLAAGIRDRFTVADSQFIVDLDSNLKNFINKLVSMQWTIQYSKCFFAVCHTTIKSTISYYYATLLQRYISNNFRLSDVAPVNSSVILSNNVLITEINVRSNVTEINLDGEPQ